MALDNFFDEYGWVLLMVLAVVALTNNKDLFQGLFEEEAAAPAPPPEEIKEQPGYIFRSNNRKKMKPKSVYF